MQVTCHLIDLECPGLGLLHTTTATLITLLYDSQCSSLRKMNCLYYSWEPFLKYKIDSFVAFETGFINIVIIIKTPSMASLFNKNTCHC